LWNAFGLTTLSRNSPEERILNANLNLAFSEFNSNYSKHLQAAQQREVKERERAERMARVAEEKRLKKEKLEERKRLEMEELQRKINQQEEAERIKKARAKEQERELMQQLKIQQLKVQQQNSAKAKLNMMPPPPKSKYTFEMLHEDDSTDDEGKVSHKRPPVPNWSRCKPIYLIYICIYFN